MSKEKQIEEMMEALKGRDSCKHLSRELCNQRPCSLCEAEILYEAGFRLQSEWISVKERLPQYNDTVLVYRPTMGEKILADTYKGDYNEDTGDWEEGWVHFGQNSLGMNVITHWMPLPEAPKGGAG